MTDQALAPAKAKQVGLGQQFTDPFAHLRDQMERLFEEFPFGWQPLVLPTRLSSRMPAPAVEMTETDKAYKVTVEVPGIAAEDIEVEAEKELLLIKGEKKEEREEKERDYTRSERSYGAFERRIRLPLDAEVGEIHAKASDGVLKITIPRNKDVRAARRKIEIKRASKG